MAVEFTSIIWILIIVFISTIHFANFTNPENEDPQISNVFFKVQRDSSGKLNVVFNNVSSSRNIEYGASNNPIRRSTSVTSRPIAPFNNNNNNNNKSEWNGIFHFPDQKNDGIQTSTPKCSKFENEFCKKVENYPAEHIKMILNQNKQEFMQAFGEDFVESSAPNITQRIDTPGEEPLCIGVEKIIYPQGGYTKHNDWSIIINQDNFTQGIRVEECLNAGKPCRMSELFPNGITTECRQSYVYRHLLSFDEKDKKVVKDLFRIPSCCKCILKNPHNF